MPSKYFTNFGFTGYELTEFHCSHLYLGEINSTVLPKIISSITDFFEDQEVPRFIVCFNQPQLFNNRRVLTASNEDFPKYYQELFTRITRYNASEYNFHPHVTLKEQDQRKEFTETVDRYVLLEKKEKEITPIYSKILISVAIPEKTLSSN